jgi:hypothetical protein
MKRFRRIIVLSLLISGACAYSTSYTQLKPPTRSAGRTAETVEIIFDAKPDRPFENIATMRSRPALGASPRDEDIGESIRTLKVEAATRGLDGVHSVQCGAPGTTGGGSCEGFGFLYVQR